MVKFTRYEFRLKIFWECYIIKRLILPLLKLIVQLHIFWNLLTEWNTSVSSVVYLISPPRFSGSTKTQTFYLILIDLFRWRAIYSQKTLTCRHILKIHGMTFVKKIRTRWFWWISLQLLKIQSFSLITLILIQFYLS